MLRPLVSIVIPVYNATQTLRACINSIISQSFENIEILLVNNGSADDSWMICQEFASVDTRIKAINHFEKGVSTARNRGIDEASGDYIMFVDADDWIDSNVCKIFAEQTKKNDYDLFCFSARYHQRKKATDAFLFKKNIDLFNASQKEELQIKVLAPQAPVLDYKTKKRFAGSAWGKFYRRDILLKYNLRFATETIISEDCLFNTLALDHFQRIGYSRACFYHYEQHENSAQNRYRPNSDIYFRFVIEQIQKWLQETKKNSRFADAANCLFVHYIFGVLKEDIFHKDNPQQILYKYNLNKLLDSPSLNKILRNTNSLYFSLPEQILIKLLYFRQFFLIKKVMEIYTVVKKII